MRLATSRSAIRWARGCAAAAVALAAILATPASAAADVTIGFDEQAPGADITAQYADAGHPGRGVTFGALPRGGATPEIITPAAGLAASAPRAGRIRPCPGPNHRRPARGPAARAAGACGAGVFGTFGVTKQRVSVHVGFGTPQLAGTTAVLTAYDASADVVDVASAPLPLSGALSAVLAISRPSPDIASFQVSAGGAEFAIDDLGFDDPVAPPPPDFAFRFSPKLQPNGLGFTDVVQGTGLSIPIDVSRANGSNGPVTFSLTGLPAFLHPALAPASVGGTGAATIALTVAADANAAPGTYTATVTGVPQTPGVGPGPHSKTVPITVVRRDIYDARIVGMEVTQGTQSPGGLVASGPGVRPYGGIALMRERQTIVRVWANNRLPVPAGGLLADVVLQAERPNGTPLPGGPILPVAAPARLAAGGPDTVSAATQGDPRSAYEFVLPWAWTRGSIRLRASVASPLDLPTLSQCTDPACAANDTMVLGGVSFTPMGVIPIHVIAEPSRGANPVLPAYALAASDTVIPANLDYNPGYDVWLDISAIENKEIACLAEANGVMAKRASCRSSAANAAASVAGDWESDNPNRDPNTGKTIDTIPVGLTTFDVGVTLGGRLHGPIFQGSPHIVAQAVWNDEKTKTLDRPLTSVAHEILHALGQNHSDQNCGGPAGGGSDSWPDAWGTLLGVGLDPSRADAKGFFPLFAPPGPKATGRGSGQPDATWYDLMSYCAVAGDGDPNSWISFTRAAGVISLYNAGTAGSGPAHVPAASTRRRAGRPVARAAGPTLAVGATLVPGAGAAIAWVKPGRRALRLPPASAYRLVARSAAGAVVGSTPMIVAAASDASGIGLTGEVPARGAASVAVETAAGAALAVRRASAHAPVARILSPRRGARVGGRGRVTIRWSASDADRDPLTTYLEYSADAGRTWRTLFIGAGRGRFALPAGALARSTRARLRVRANDGFREGTSVSGAFASLGAPPAAVIDQPAPGARLSVRAGGVLALAGRAADDAGRRLRGASLRWFSGRTALGRGERIAAATLPPGAQRITLIARDRFGRTGRASVAVRVLRAAPAVLRLRGPRTVSRRARSVAITLAALPSAQVRVGGQRFAVGPRPRRYRIAIAPGRGTLTLRLRFSGGGSATVRTLVIPRR